MRISDVTKDKPLREHVQSRRVSESECLGRWGWGGGGGRFGGGGRGRSWGGGDVGDRERDREGCPEREMEGVRGGESDTEGKSGVCVGFFLCVCVVFVVVVVVVFLGGGGGDM